MALNQAAVLACFHQYLDPAAGTICGGLYRGHVCNLDFQFQSLWNWSVLSWNTFHLTSNCIAKLNFCTNWDCHSELTGVPSFHQNIPQNLLGRPWNKRLNVVFPTRCVLISLVWSISSFQRLNVASTKANPGKGCRRLWRICEILRPLHYQQSIITHHHPSSSNLNPHALSHPSISSITNQLPKQCFIQFQKMVEVIWWVGGSFGIWNLRGSFHRETSSFQTNGVLPNDPPQNP